MGKIRKVLAKVSNKKIAAVIVSTFFVLSIASPTFAEFNAVQNNATQNDVLQNSQAGVTTKIEGESTFVKNISENGKNYAVFKNGDKQFAVEFSGELTAGKVVFNSENVTIEGAVGGILVVKAQEAAFKDLQFNSLSLSNSDVNNITNSVPATQSNAAANVTVSQNIPKTTVINLSKKVTKTKKKSKAKKTKKSTKSKKKADKSKKKSNKSVKKTTKSWTDKKGNVHSSVTTKTKNKKGVTKITTKTTVKDAKGKTIKTGTTKTTITKNKKGGFKKVTNSVIKDAKGNTIKESTQSLNIDKKGNVTGTKTITQDGKTVTYDVSGKRKSVKDKNGNTKTVYNLTLKDKKTGDITKIKTENVYNKSSNCISSQRWENGKLTKVETNGVLQFAKDSKGNANFYNDGKYSSAIKAKDFKGLTNAQRNNVIQKEIKNPGTAKKQIAKVQNFYSSCNKKTLDNYTYDKGKVTLEYKNGSDTYKIVVKNVGSDKDCVKLGDAAWKGKNLNNLLKNKNYEVDIYYNGKKIGGKDKGKINILF